MTVTEGEVVEGRGRRVRLADGTTEWLRFGFYELRAVERRFGSVQQAIGRLAELKEHGDRAAIFGLLADLVACGLNVRRSTRDGRPFWLCDDPDEAAIYMDVAQFGPYLEAFNEAITEAMASLAPEGGGDADPPATSPSPGAPGTTRPSSPSASPQPPSGP